MRFKYVFAYLGILAAIAGSSSCVKEVSADQAGPFRLVPAVQGLSTKAETPGEADRDENKLGDHLDVFFQGAETGNKDFWKEYHLSGCSFTDPSGELLSGNWMEDGFVPGAKYNVYVLVNGPEAAHRYVGSYSGLMYLAQTDEEINKVKQAEGDKTDVGDSGFYTSRKLLMMDSAILNWTPVAGQSTQTINMQTALKPLKRAAAKIEVSISFDPTFLDGLIDGGEKPGAAMFKYDRFAFSSPAFAFGAPVTPDIRTAGWLTYANVNTVNDGTNTYSYKITTYSFARSWTSAEAPLDAPSLLVSIPFIESGTSNTTYHYYRIPVAAPGELSLERNHIYKVSAVINSKGSWKEAEAEIPLNLKYSVLEWTQDAREDTDVDENLATFFDVEPREQAIWGDGTQSVTLKYHAPAGAAITIAAIPNADLASDGASRSDFATTHTVSGSTYQALYVDNAGASKDSEASGATVSFSINVAKQEITVSSTALANHAPKYIRFRVVCNGNTGDAKNIYLRHFPTVNIQNIPGWFSYKNESSTTPQYTFNPDLESPAWTSWDGMDAEATACPDWTTYNNAKDPDKNERATITNQRRVQPSSGQYHRMEGPVEVSQAEFQAALADSENRQYANGAANAVQGSSGVYALSYYYGIDPYEFDYSVLGGSDPEGTDYWTKTGPLGYHYIRYTKYYKVTYYTGYARRYFRYASSYDFVRWIPDSQTPYSPRKKGIRGGTADLFMNAKVYIDGTIYYVNDSNVGGGYYRATQGDSRGANSSNNHMYVIQTSEGSGNVGYPIVDETTHTSKDNVVSPAFMLASQLGATDQRGFANYINEAPGHCAKYVETTKISDTEAKIYSGWRLPTKAEFNLIVSLQSLNKDAMVEVLQTNSCYGTLPGGADSFEKVTSSSDIGRKFVRCVRDLTPAEVAELNKIK